MEKEVTLWQLKMIGVRKTKRGQLIVDENKVPTETVFSATDRSGRLTQTHLEEINKRTETVSNRDGSKQRWRIEKANKQEGEQI